MKILWFIFFQTFIIVCANAQTGIQKDSVVITKAMLDESESDFPGGVAGWRKFLGENLVYPKKAERKKIEGTVVVQFIVDKDGTISDIKAISGPELLQEAAADVIKKSPNWIPAMQNGRKVKSYKKQPITFRLQ